METMPKAPEMPQELNNLTRRGLDLMVEHQNLVQMVVAGTVGVERLMAFTQGLSEEEFDEMVAQEIEAAKRRTKTQKLALVMAYDENPTPVGRR